MSTMIFSSLFVAMLWLAAIMQFAVVRDRTIYDSRLGTSHRWLVVGGLTGLAMRFSYLVIDVGYLPVPWQTLASVSLFALGSIGLGMEKLFGGKPFQGPDRRCLLSRRQYQPPPKRTGASA